MITAILGIIVALAALVFAFQNNDLIQVEFLVWDIESSLALVIIAGILAGFVVAFMLATGIMIKSSARVQELKNKIKELDDKKESVGIVYESEGLGSQGETLETKNNQSNE